VDCGANGLKLLGSEYRCRKSLVVSADTYVKSTSCFRRRDTYECHAVAFGSKNLVTSPREERPKRIGPDPSATGQTALRQRTVIQSVRCLFIHSLPRNTSRSIETDRAHMLCRILVRCFNLSVNNNMLFFSCE